MRAAERNPRTGKRLRCRLHGGLSTGPRSTEGKARVAAATFRRAFRHGLRSAEAKRAREEIRRMLETLKKCREEVTP